jgi:hypothetical protein
MVFRDFVDLETANELVGGVVLAYWSRAHFWAEQRRQHTEQRRIPGMVRMADETHCRASSNARLLTRAYPAGSAPELKIGAFLTES